MQTKGSVRILMLPFFFIVDASENISMQGCCHVQKISYKSQHKR